MQPEVSVVDSATSSEPPLGWQSEVGSEVMQREGQFFAINNDHVSQYQYSPLFLSDDSLLL